jgi:hypothetical protein
MDIKPQIVIEDYQGRHNADPNSSDRLIKGNTYRDLSTICIVPTRGMITAKVVQNWMGLMPLMNQKFIRIFVIGMEVGEAYAQAMEMILAHPDLSNWQYILTLEEDNLPPPDGLSKLIESINQGFDAVGGLYWTKGPAGQPMIYGDPAVMPRNFIPQVPCPDTIQPCNGLGMGFTLFKVSMFKDPRLPRPLFKTMSEYKPGFGCQVFTQDLYFFNNAVALGYKFACDTRVRVGHYDYEGVAGEPDTVW